MSKMSVRKWALALVLTVIPVSAFAAYKVSDSNCDCDKTGKCSCEKDCTCKSCGRK